MWLGWTGAALAGTTRLALMVGANDGGPDRPALRYAQQDAESVRDVLVQLGGVAPEDAVVLREPTPDGIRAALADLDRRARAVAADGTGVEVVLYYSGHSDAEGLRLAAGELSFAELRTRFEGLGADTALLVLDSCASGAFVRAKGGALVHPPWEDDANRARGRAVVTSSAATEASQEADTLGGSFFTAAFTTGLRGAADRDADRRVTLTEAYDFAFDATRFATAGAGSGTQHPEREIQLYGAGELVMTDLQTPSAELRLGADVVGRVMVRDGAGRLVVDVAKAPGTAVALGLPDGPATLSVSGTGGEYVGAVTLTTGQVTEIGADDLTRVRAVQTRWRGDPPPSRTPLWIATGSLLGLSAVSGAVAAHESRYYPWYPTDSTLSRVSSATFVVSGGVGTALLIGLVVDEIRRDR